MSTSSNEVWVRGERLQLDEETQLLPSFQANDRTKPDTIQSDYSPEFSVPGSTHNHRLLRHAAASQPAQGAAYARVPAVLTSGGVETLPLALLYIKGYSEGRYQLQLFGGNRRLVEQLGDKMLSDLDFSRFNHNWTPANIAARLSYGYWEAQGYGYSILERGKTIDIQNIDPYTLFPGVAARLIWEQILFDAGFTADSLLGEPLFAALNVPSANPFVFDEDFRKTRSLNAGFEYYPAGNVSDGRPSDGAFHEDEFPAEQLAFEFTDSAPFHAPTQGATYTTGRTYHVDTLGYHDFSVTVPVRYGCRGEFYGQVSCQVMLYVNGQPVYQGGQQVGIDYHRITSNAETDDGAGYMTRTFTPKLERYLLSPTDRIEVFWQGDNWRTGPLNANPTDPYWQIGPAKGITVVPLPNGNRLVTQSSFKVDLREEFPEGGLIKLNEWLPQGMKQLEFVKTVMELLGLTIVCDNYRPHLHLATGNKLLENVSIARDWSSKLDLFAPPGRLPERDLTFKFGDYGQKNLLKWEEDENVTEGYGDGQILVADETLPVEYEMATLPFAATEPSRVVFDLLRILNYKASDITVQPPTYETVEAKPRLTLRGPAHVVSGKLIISQGVTQAFTTTADYFAGADLSLMLNETVLTQYWSDLKSMLDESRYLVERFRLTPGDIAELDYSIPVWVAAFQDYFCVSKVEEFSANRPTTAHLVRLNSTHLPPPVLPGEGQEWYGQEYYTGEFY